MTSEDKRIGIFVKIYRNEPTMYRAIDSVLIQTYKNFKFYILVNEKTKDNVRKYVKHDERVVLIDGGPRDGFTSQVKHIANDNNDFVTPLDADDWYAGNYLEETLNFSNAYGTDITAIGNYFVNAEEKKVGVRQQAQLIYNIEDIGDNFWKSYAFFRTAWGKLYRSNLLMNYDGERLPEIEAYGGYGGDTLFVLDLLRTAKTVGICDKVLYYYQVSATSSSRWFEKGRLDSDEVLLRYAENVLKELGGMSAKNYVFLRVIYGNALMDTIILLLQVKMEERDRINNLLYLLKKSTIHEFIALDHKKILVGNGITFVDKMRKMLFENRAGIINSHGLEKEYLELLGILYPRTRGKISNMQFRIILSNIVMLEPFVNEEYKKLFDLLLDSLPNITEKKEILSFLKKFSGNVLLNKILTQEGIVEEYPELVKMISHNRLTEALDICMNVFETKERVLYAEELIDIWIDLAATLENASLFILGMQLKVELLCNNHDFEHALSIYKELEDLQVQDENMKYLKKLLLD